MISGFFLQEIRTWKCKKTRRTGLTFVTFSAKWWILEWHFLWYHMTSFEWQWYLIKERAFKSSGLLSLYLKVIRRVYLKRFFIQYFKNEVKNFFSIYLGTRRRNKYPNCNFFCLAYMYSLNFKTLLLLLLHIS